MGRNPKEILKHVKQHHPWLGWTIEDAKNLLKQEMESMNENEIDWLDFVDPKEYEDNVKAVKMKWINMMSKMGLSSDKIILDSDNETLKEALENLFEEKQTLTKIENNQIEASDKENTPV